MIRNLKKSDVIIDIGANTGAHTLKLAEHLQDGQVDN